MRPAIEGGGYSSESPADPPEVYGTRRVAARTRCRTTPARRAGSMQPRPRRGSRRYRRRCSRTRAGPRACAGPAAAPDGRRAPAWPRSGPGSPRALVAPASGCTRSTTMPRASVCGWVSASPIVCTGPAGTPAASNTAIHCAGALPEDVVHRRRARRDVAMRAALVTKRGSLRHSGCPSTSAMRSQFAWLAPPMLIQPSLASERLVGRGEDVRRARRARATRRWRSRSPRASRSAAARLPSARCRRPGRRRCCSWCAYAASDAERGQDAGVDVGDRVAGLGRRAARLAGDRHQAGEALRDEVEAALVGERAGRARSPRPRSR